MDAITELVRRLQAESAAEGIEAWDCPRCGSTNHHTDPTEGCTSCPWVQAD